MPSKTNHTVIGLFVVGAVGLLVAGILAFGRHTWGAETTQFVLFFEGSVSGLNTGAPVVMKGVRIGSVTDATLRMNWENLDFKTQVLIEVSAGSSIVEDRGAQESFRGRNKAALLKKMVDRGLRAQLQLQSMVTGQQMIALDFYPDDKQPRIVGAAPEYLEIPTITSSITKMTRTLEQIPLDDIATNLNRAVEGVEELINSAQTKETLASLNKMMKELATFSETLNTTPVMEDLDQLLKDGRKLAQNLDRQIEPLSTQLSDALGDARKLVGRVEGKMDQLDPLVADFRGAAQSAAASFATARELLATFQGMAPQDSVLAREVTTTLRAVSGAMNAVRHLASYLEQHPEALLSGKKQ